MERVYIETSVVSYLTARRSRDLVIAAHQELTMQWWEQRGGLFERVVSELVLKEVGKGDPMAAEERMALVEKLPVLPTTNEAVSLANLLVSHGPIPQSSAADALHIAVAAVNGVEYLLTWNCKHLANAAHRYQIEALMLNAEYLCPIICTPEELMEE